MWSGDVDLNDGQLERKFKEMHDRLLFVKYLGLSSRSRSVILTKDLEVILEYSKEDSKFILHGRNLKNTKTKTLFLNKYFVIVELRRSVKGGTYHDENSQQHLHLDEQLCQ